MSVDVTAVIPTRNRRALLLATLETVRWQRDVGWEAVVVDDASTDDTRAAVDALGDPRIQVLRHSTAQGVSSARNTGIDAARGAWVAFLDDDDLWAPDKLARQLEEARRTGRDWAYTGVVTVEQATGLVVGGPPPAPEDLLESLARQNSVYGGGSHVIVRRAALRSAGRFDPGLRVTEDWDMWLKLAAGGPPACVPEPLAAYRLHSTNLGLRGADVAAELAILRARHGIAPDEAAFLRWTGWAHVRNDRRGRALLAYLRAAAARRDRTALAHLRADLALVAGAYWGVVRRRRRPHGGNRQADPWVQQAMQWLSLLPEFRP